MTTEMLPIKDVILLRDAPEPEDGEEPLGWRLAQQTGRLVIELPSGTTLESIDEDGMRAAGWVRA